MELLTDQLQNFTLLSCLVMEVLDSKDDLARETEQDSDVSATDKHPQRGAAQRARQKLAEWIQTIHAPPEDVEDGI